MGREADLLHLARSLKPGGTAAIGQIAAATGLGGIGKSQLAVEFAHRFGQYFAGGVFWVSMADPESVSTEVALCGGAGGMNLRPDFGDRPLDEQVAAVLSAWRSPLPRLLVFDNCEDEELLSRWRPPDGGCRVLVTSRRPEWDPTLGVEALPLGVLSREESVALLVEFRPDLGTSDTGLAAIAEELQLRWVAENALSRADSQAGGLWNELGYHLRLTGAYAGATGQTIDTTDRLSLPAVIGYRGEVEHGGRRSEPG